MSLLGSTPPQIRTQLRNQLIAAAVPPAIADEAVDLGIHAAEAARELLASIVSRGSSLPVQSAAFSIAVGLVENALYKEDQAKVDQASRDGLRGANIMDSYCSIAPDAAGGPDHG